MNRGYTQYPENITVIVRKDGGTGTAPTQQQGAKENSPSGKQDEKNNNSFSLLLGKSNEPSATISHVGNFIVSTIKDYVQIENSFISARNGDKALQEQVDRRVEIITERANVMVSTITGFAAGGAVGAALALAGSAISLKKKYAGRQRNYDIQIFKENNNIQYMRARAGINLTTGRLR